MLKGHVMANYSATDFGTVQGRRSDEAVQTATWRPRRALFFILASSAFLWSGLLSLAIR